MSPEQSVRLTHEQRLQVEATLLTLRFDLIEALFGTQYHPSGHCPQCGRNLTNLEIIKGFTRDPNDYTTRCVSCGTRFEPVLRFRGDIASGEMPFYCASQTLDKLHGWETQPAEAIMKAMPAAYHSARIHYGGLRQAFLRMGAQYPFSEVPAWKDKVKPFLGQLPDTVIARMVDHSVRTVRALRNQLGVAPMRRSALASRAA